MTFRLLIGSVLLLGLEVWWPSTAIAQTVLDYDAPDECPDEDTVGRALIRRVEAQPDGSDERIVAIRVARVPEAEDPYVVEITLEGPGVGGARRIAGRECSTLVNAGIVIAALALGPRHEALQETLDESAASEPALPTPEAPAAEPTASPPPPEGAVPPTQESTVQPDITPEPSSGASSLESRPGSSPRDRAIHLGGALLGRLSLGEAPTVTGGVALGLTLSRRRFRAELAFQWLPKSEGSVQGERSAGAEFAFFSAELRGCGDLVTRPIILSLCGGAEIGATRAVGQGVDVTNTQRVFWIAPEAGALFLWPLTRSGRIALRIDAAILVPLYRTTFYIEGIGDIYRPSPVAGKFGLGFFVNFF